MYRLLVIPLPSLSRNMEKSSAYPTAKVDVSEFQKVLNADMLAVPGTVEGFSVVGEFIYILIKAK